MNPVHSVGQEAGPVHLDVEEEQPAQVREQVWMSVLRRGLEYHEIGESGTTVCGRSTRTGVVLDRDDAVADHAAIECRRACFTAPATPVPVAQPAGVVLDELAEAVTDALTAAARKVDAQFGGRPLLWRKPAGWTDAEWDTHRADRDLATVAQCRAWRHNVAAGMDRHEAAARALLEVR